MYACGQGQSKVEEKHVDFGWGKKKEAVFE